MPGTAVLCTCRGTEYVHRRDRTRRPDQCKRKRQVLVYNPEEEIWHEPYMQTLRREFSDESVECDSKIELPWSDIALPSVGMKIRSQMAPAAGRGTDGEAATRGVKGEKRESTSTMELPWQELIIAKIPRRAQVEEPDICDSSVEIPWADLALEKTVIRPTEEQACASEDVEIPWDEILVPRNIVIKPQRKRRHPSSDRPPRPVRVNVACISCVCCAKIRAKIRSDPQTKTHPNPGSDWIRSSM